MKEFLLSDETVNSYGFAVLTSGISLERFTQNPVMFLNHDRDKGIAGKWENLRIEASKLYGTPVFDSKHEPGKTAAEQTQGGFLNGASIGIDNLLMSEINGIQTVVSCELTEVSVCDIPSNKNALQLYFKGTPVTLSKYKELSLNTNNMQTTDLKRIAAALSLPEGATVDEICAEINTINAVLPQNVTLMMAEAVKLNVITQEESAELVTLAGNNPVSLARFIRKKKELYMKKQSDDYDKFVNHGESRGKFVGFYSDEKLKQLALNDLDTFKRYINQNVHTFHFRDVLNLRSGDNPRNDWTLEDYRKNAPQALVADPDLYQRLIQEERSRK